LISGERETISFVEKAEWVPRPGWTLLRRYESGVSAGKQTSAVHLNRSVEEKKIVYYAISELLSRNIFGIKRGEYDPLVIYLTWRISEMQEYFDRYVSVFV
jgi:hypothetical protein